MIKKIIKISLISLALLSSLNASDHKYFLGLSTGISTMTVDKKDQVGSVSLITQPDDNGASFNLELGFSYNLTTFMTIGVNHQKYNDIKLYNYLISFNKKIKPIPSLYAGVLLGMSYIELTKEHIDLPILDKRGKKFAIGAQIGYEKTINNNLIFFTQYQYLKAKHKTLLETTTASSELVRDNYSIISVGIRWKF